MITLKVQSCLFIPKNSKKNSWIYALIFKRALFNFLCPKKIEKLMLNVVFNSYSLCRVFITTKLGCKQHFNTVYDTYMNGTNVAYYSFFFPSLEELTMLACLIHFMLLMQLKSLDHINILCDSLIFGGVIFSTLSRPMVINSLWCWLVLFDSRNIQWLFNKNI